jgi:hypothetical protein
MSRPSPRRHHKIRIQFAWQPTEMLASPAYRVLSLSAHRVLDRIQIELGCHAGRDNGRLTVTYEDFVAAQTATQSRQQFASLRRWAFSRSQSMVAPGMLSLDRRTFRPTEAGDAADEWRRIETVEKATAIAKAARKSARTAVKKEKLTHGLRPLAGHRNGKAGMSGLRVFLTIHDQHIILAGWKFLR